MIEFQKIYTATDYLEMQRVLDALTGEHIPAYAQERGAGQYFQIKSGVAFVEKDIYVEKGDAEKAGHLIRCLKEMGLEEGGIPEENYRVPWYRNRRIAARILVGVLFAFFLGLIICAVVFQ